MIPPVSLSAAFTTVIHLIAFTGKTIFRNSPTAVFTSGLIGPSHRVIIVGINPILFLKLYNHDGLIVLRYLQVTNHHTLSEFITGSNLQHIIVLANKFCVLSWVEFFAGVDPGCSIVAICSISISVILFGKLNQSFQ